MERHVCYHTTSPIEGQKTGTSGMRKKVAAIEHIPNFFENWVQSLVNALGGPTVLAGSTFVLGGDGRYLNDRAAKAVIEVLAGNKVGRVIVGRSGLMSTPAVSNLIRQRKALGGIIMTASHNAAGPAGDWGIKFNYHGGEPAPEKVTDKVFEETKKIDRFATADLGDIDLSQLGIQSFAIVDDSLPDSAPFEFSLEVVDPVTDYVALLRSIFDFPSIGNFLRENTMLVFDGMHAVTGVYAKRIFQDELGLEPGRSLTLLNCEPRSDFAGHHPDPNLVYAKDLLAVVSNLARANGDEKIIIGAASDGDGDRNMIVGGRKSNSADSPDYWFVTPSDSLAVLTEYANEAIPYFARRPLSGVARSMPTSRAVDAVCDAKNIARFETPTGWKFFGNLMDAGKVSLCGEESFGTGADHIREKDGIWAVLAWISVVEFVNRNEGDKIRDIQAINESHWDKYGRHMYCRCDYDEVSAEAGNAVMEHVRQLMRGNSLVNKSFSKDWTIASATEYCYTDPIDHSVAANQGMIIKFTNGSRIVLRLSGTGSQGATIRLYMEYFVKDWRNEAFRELSLERSELMAIAQEICQIENFTGRKEPSVVT